ncbi:MBL fold metallo-hydrolase, partial [Agrobacterium sp. S2]|nr:MBL fold metallo-hydrolase [Agrobacterium sp. S2]
YDTTYTDAEMPRHIGYGTLPGSMPSGSPKQRAQKNVAFIHHSPLRTDAELEAIDRQAASEFAGAFSAREGQTFDV